MLERESKRWNDLSGPAGMSGRRVIDAIYALSNEQYIDDTVGDKLGFWEIYNQLCHQGTIYMLTYAAIPHLLPAINGKTLIPPIRALFLLADINISYKSTAFAPPEIPEDLKQNFVETLSVAKDIVIQNFSQSNLTANEFIECLMATAGLNNLSNVNLAIDHIFFDQGVYGRCTHCSAEVEILCNNTPFSIQFMEPHKKFPKTAMGRPKGPLTYVTPKHFLESSWNGAIEEDNAQNWLSHFARVSKQNEFSEKLRYVYGEFMCPACSKTQTTWTASLNASRLAGSP